MFQKYTTDKNSPLLQRFIDAHPKLMELKPKIELRHITEDERGTCDYYEIHITYPFIFDIRLIPEKFNGVKVISGFAADEGLPSIFQSGNAEVFLGDLFSAEQYEKFAENNIEKIRIKLKRPDLGKLEALDALTGDFEKHKAFINNLKQQRLDEHKGHIAFFNVLLKEIENAYQESDVFKIYKEKNWGYSVTATSFRKNSPVVVGFNWGSGKNWQKENKINVIQKDYQFSSFGNLYNELGSLKRVAKLFYSYFPEGMNCVQTNFCFFRSEKENQISAKDLELCTPIFEKLIKYLEPSIIISFSHKLHDYFAKENMLKDTTTKNIEYKSGNNNRILNVCKGKVKIGNFMIEYCKLPHPNYPIHSEVRTKAWEYCFQKN